MIIKPKLIKQSIYNHNKLTHKLTYRTKKNWMKKQE